MSLVNVFQAQSDAFFKIVLKYSQNNVTTEPSQNHNCIAHYINNTVLLLGWPKKFVWVFPYQLMRKSR